MAKRLRQTAPVTTYVLYGALTACFVLAVVVALVSHAR
jgi:hypothetical protein